MKSLPEALQAVLSQPTPEALVALQGALLARDPDTSRRQDALAVATRFHTYLSELRNKITARQYSELASRLDISAVGVIALESLLATEQCDFWQRFLLGGLAEGLMVIASRQYVKGWQAETDLAHSRAAWYLSEALWHTSRQMQPALPAEERWQAIRTLLAPADDPAVSAPEKAVLLGRIFQVLLLAHVAALLDED